MRMLGLICGLVALALAFALGAYGSGVVDLVFIPAPCSPSSDSTCATNLSAEATRIIARWTAVGAIFAILGGTATSAAAIFAYRAFQQAERSAHEMEVANRLAKEAGERRDSEAAYAKRLRDQERADEQRAERRQFRAYVDFEGVTCELKNPSPPARRGRIPAETTREAVVRLKLKNFGRTPANELKVRSTYGLRGEGDDAFVTSAVNDGDGLGGIMPSDEWARPITCKLPQKYVIAVEAGDLDFDVEFVVEYEDSYGEKHELKSTYRAESFDGTMGFVPHSRSST